MREERVRKIALLTTDNSKIDTLNGNLSDTMEFCFRIEVYDAFSDGNYSLSVNSKAPNLGGRACSETLVWSCVVCFIAARAEIETIYSCIISTKINTVFSTISQRRNYFLFDQSFYPKYTTIFLNVY